MECFINHRPTHIWSVIIYLFIFIKDPKQFPSTFFHSQKDPHTLYLEQELQSLKVVLDIKNTQVHQQEKKLMEIDKLVRR